MSEEKTQQQIKDARELEAEKTRQQRAEDIAYTINHAVSCGVTDIFVQPGISALVTKADQDGKLPKWLTWTKNIFEEHDHGADGHKDGHGHGHDHDHPHTHIHANDCKHEHSAEFNLGGKAKKAASGFHCEEVPKVNVASLTEELGKTSALTDHGHSFSENVVHWFTGEIIGDVGAVPLTIGVQRMFPNFMHSMRNTLEPIAKPMFMWGADRSAKDWAKHNGFAADASETIEKKQAMYEHEISHLPQALVWNCFSFPINLTAQFFMFDKKPKDIPMMVVAKTFGAVFSNTALIGGRAVIPDSASQWDQWSGKNIVIPTTKAVGGLFGVDSETVDRVAKKQAEAEGHSGWKSREEKKRAEPTTATPSQAIG